VSVATAPSLAKPRRLRRGDRVALLAPASAFKRDDFDAGVAELSRLGFEPTWDDRVFARGRFAAGDPALRAAALNDAWADPDVAALVAVRGGYGSAQTLPLLDAARMRQAQKVFIGYSDVTALLSFHLQHGVVCFHGPMVERRLAAGDSGYHRDSLIRAVMNAEPLGRLTPPALESLREGEASGLLVGGTLTQLTASLGTPWAFAPPDGCILFVEDIAERPYRVDRMLTQLRQAGTLSRARGIVFGEMPSCDEPGGEHRIRDVLRDALAWFPGPVLFGFPSGHTAGPTWTLPLGVRARVEASAAPALIVEEAAVQ
jgi:muramoyltetrapeptide carboxypeptidase